MLITRNKITAYMPFILLLFFLFGCEKSEGVEVIDEDENSEGLYFPPVTGNEWATVDPTLLGWNTDAIPALETFLEESKTRAFILLSDGKIALEYYKGKTLLGTDFGQRNNWYWASAGKALTATLIGIAQEQGHLDIDDSSIEYLGQGWTSMTPDQEKEITVKHHLTMTTGLDDNDDVDCWDSACLTYLAEPGTRWAYHNAPYTILDKVIEGSTGQSFPTYFNDNLRDKIGMDGDWRRLGFNNVFFSTARSMARFGLLILNEGVWDDEVIISDKKYIQEMTTPSQVLNPAYGYLWWLNGQQPMLIPRLRIPLNRPVTTTAPDEMIAAIGKNGQILSILPSDGLIMVRMGEETTAQFVPFDILDNLWAHISTITNR